MKDGGGVSVQAFWEDADDADALQQYRTLVNTVEDGIYQLDAAGRVVAVNDALVGLIGFDREDVLGEPASRFVSDDDHERIDREIRRRLAEPDAEGRAVEFDAVTADGGTVPCELQVNALVEDGVFRGSVGIVRDISERRRTERSLREHERRLERERDLNDRILGASPVGILVLGGDGEVRRVNDRGRELLGVDDLEEYSLADVTVYDDDGNRHPIGEHPLAAAVRDGEQVDDRDLRVELPDGSRRWLSVSASAVRSDDGEIERVVITGEDVTRFKERERELEARRDELDARVEEIYGRISDGMVAVDESWRFTHVNERAEEMLGIDADELVGERAWDTHPEVLDTEVEAHYREAMETGEPVSFETYFEPYDAWFEERVYPSETGLSIYFRDVTDRKEREQELERYETIVDAVDDGIYTVDEDGRFTWVNETYASMLGYEREELVGEHVNVVADEETVERAREVGREMREGDREVASMEALLRTKDGGTVPAEATFALLPCGERVGVARDVSERVAVERELREERDLVEGIVETTPDGITVVDADGQMVFANERAEEILGRPREEITTFSHDDPRWDLVDEDGDPPAEGETPFERVLERGDAVFDAVIGVRRPSGERVWLSVSGAPRSRVDGTGGAVFTLHDVTDQRRVEDELEEILGRVTDAFYALDEEFHFTHVNDRAEELLQCDRAELLGEELWEMFPEAAEVDEVWDAFHDAMTTQASQSFELYFDPLEFWVQATVYPSETGVSVYFRDVTERKEYESHLQDAKDQLEAATRAGAVGTWEWHVREDRFVAGESFARLFGVDPERAREGVSLDRFVDGIHEDDRGQIEREIEEVLESCGEYEAEYRVRTADDEVRWVLARGHVECDDDGEPVRLPGSLVDITDRKRAEIALEEQRNQLETLFEVLPVGVVVAEDGELVEANDSVKEIWGGDVFDAESVADYDRYRGWWADTGESVDPEEWTMSRVLDGEEVIDPDVFEIETADGERRIVMIHGMPVRDDSDEVIRGVVTQTDITERREYQRRLEESERRYRTLVENFPDGAVGLFDEDLNYTAVGGELLEAVGVDPEERVGRSLSELYPDDLLEELEPHFHAALEGEKRTFETEYHDRHLLAHTVPIRDADGEVFAGMLVVQDVTERVEYERELAALNRLNEVIRTTSVAAASATSREEIEQRVCERLVEMEPFTFAWVSQLERGQSTVTASTAAGADDGYLEELTISVDDSETGSGPTGTAVRTGEPQFVHDVREDPAFAPWREAAEERGFRSTAALPIAHEGATYGVLNVYATEPHAFEGPEGEMLAQLSELVGHAVHAVEQRKALVSDTVTELELVVHDDGPLFDVTNGGDASITVDRRVPAGGDRYVNFVTARNVDRESFLSVMGDREHVSNVECIGEDGDELHFELTMTELPISEVLANHGGRLRELTVADGSYRIVAEVPPDADVRGLVEALGERHSETELLAQRTSVRDPATGQDLQRAVLERLTEKQRSALEAAYFAGYFEWPRLSTGEKVAELLGVSPATFTQHLRNAELKLFETVFEERSATA